MNAPPGATVKPNTTGVTVTKGDGFQLSIRPDDDKFGQLLMDEARKGIDKKGVQVVQNQEDALIVGSKAFGQEAFQCIVKVTVGGKPYVCTGLSGGGTDFTRAQAVIMGECAKSLTQTEANKQAEVRMQQAMARFKELGCRFKPAFNILEIEGEQVSDADLALAKDLPQTTVAVISAEKLTPVGLKHLHDLPNLHGITLRGEAVTDGWLASLAHLPLRRLWLFGTAINSAGWQHLAELPTLDELKIRDQPMDVAALQHLGGMPKLSELQLLNTSTTDAGLKHLSALKVLQLLDLTGNPVTDAGLEHLAGLQKLFKLDLTNTKVTKAGVQQLKKTLPKCEILIESN
jgi:hypothetical protein